MAFGLLAALGGTSAVTVICLFLLISRPAPRIVQRLADCSLGIYCVHIFVKPSAGIAAVPNHFAQFLIVLIVSIAIVAFLHTPWPGR